MMYQHCKYLYVLSVPRLQSGRQSFSYFHFFLYFREKKPKIWEEFQLGINRYEVYSFNSSVIDDLLRYLGGTNIKNVGE